MKRSEDFSLRNVGGQDILVPLGSKVLDMNALITLNATGRSVWELLAEECSLEDLVAGIVKEYDIDEGAARADVQTFLHQLGQLGMLKT